MGSGLPIMARLECYVLMKSNIDEGSLLCFLLVRKSYGVEKC